MAVLHCQLGMRNHSVCLSCHLTTVPPLTLTHTSPLLPYSCDNVDLNEMRWSPRRHHGAAWIDKEIFVLGGRARALEDIAEDEAIGR